MKNLITSLLLVCAGMTALYAKEPNLPKAIQINNTPPTISFIENVGQVTDQYHQFRSDIDLKLEGGGVNVFVGDGAIHYQWVKQTVGDQHNSPDAVEKDINIDLYRMDVELIGANKNAMLTKEGAQAYYEQYYTEWSGEAGRKAGSYNRAVYKNVYPNIDWTLYIKNGKLKYDFIVHPGGDPADIRLQYKGATALALKQGALTATTPLGTITEAAPYSYEAEAKNTIHSAYELKDGILNFKTGEYKGTLIIDPVLEWATYYTGNTGTSAASTAMDAMGNSYLGGQTISTSNIATTGTHQTSFASTNSNDYDLYVVKFNPAGTRQWATYYGGSGSDVKGIITCDAAGNVYLAGGTNSQSGIATTGAFQSVASSTNLFLAKLNSNGTRQWGTYFAGSSSGNYYADVWDLSCDPAGNVYMCGSTNLSTNIATPGSYQTSPSINSNNSFLVKFSGNGSRLWGTYYGHGIFCTITCDNSGNVLAAGVAYAPGLASPGAYQTTPSNSDDGMLVKFTPSGSRLWATYYGGNMYDRIWDADCDATGNVYICGETSSTNGIATPGTYQPSKSGTSFVGFLTQFDPAGNLNWGTYYYGPSSGNAETIGTVAADANGTVFVAGYTFSSSGMTTTGATQTNYGGNGDAFIAQFDNSGNRTWATYYGGSGLEGTGTGYTTANCPFFACNGSRLVLAGITRSSAGIATSNGHQTSLPTGVVGGGFLASFSVDTMVYIVQPYKDTVFCPGDTFRLAYGVTPAFRSGNGFTAQLSDASGSFASPVNIGTKTQTGADSIFCTIPANMPAGTGYRVRVVASMPARTSVNNGIDIRIKPVPVPTASANSPCAGLPLNLTATALTGSTFSWSGPLSYSSTQQNPVINPSVLNNSGDYIVTATKEGCIAKDTVAVTILPVPPAPTAVNNGPLCPGDSLKLDATIPGWSGSFNWTGPMSFTSGQQTPSPVLNVQVGNAGVYTVNFTANNGCAAPSATTTLTVKPLPTTPIATSNSPVCGGGDISFTASSTPGSTFQWSGPNGFTATGATPTINPASAAHAGTYQVVATLNGCKSAAAATTNVVVNVVSSGGAYASPNDTICPGGTATFVVMPQNAGPSPSFQWCKNGNIIPSATNKVFTTNGMQDRDSVYCRMIVTNVCASALTIYTNAVKMAIIPGITVAPVVTVTSAPAQPIPGQPVTFNAVATSGGGMSPTYQWQRNGINVSGAINATFSVSNLTPGEQVSCIMNSSDVCASAGADTSNIIIANFPTHIENVNAGGFNLYPNPNKGSFTVKGDFNQKDVVVEVLNAVGQVVYSNVITPAHGEIKIDMGSHVAQGVYLLRMKDGGVMTQVRFTVVE